MNPSTKNDLKMLVFALIIYAIIMGLTSAGALNAFWQLNLVFAGINIILAASLNLINGYTGQFSLGHAGFMAVGAYVGVVLTTNFHLPFAAALLAGGIAASACRRCACAATTSPSRPSVWARSSASSSSTSPISAVRQDLRASRISRISRGCSSSCSPRSTSSRTL